MSRITLEIDEVTLQAEAEREQLEGAAPAIQEAFRLLAERLDRTPFGGSGEARQFSIDLLEITVLPLDELLSPRGAERLADELYRQFLRKTL